MEIRPNCSADCDARFCVIHPATINSQQSRDILLKLCNLFTRVVEVQSRTLSPVLCAVVWTLLSCGILLALFFLLFTIRYKTNRIVKMSSPNLNILTLVGSVLTYISGFLFAVEDRSPVLGTGARAVLQVRIWTLCIGSTLVFGPILGKTWRIYRVFTQRLPDRRVIIRDIQLMALVVLLILVELVVLAVWSLIDSVKCSRTVSAVVKVVELDIRYSLSQLDSCSSQYLDLWVLLLFAFKASLLLYGTYLAGLTSNVSLPPVNQSLTIISAVCLVTASTAVAVPVSRYLYTWPNLVYGVLAGSIFICTTAINCFLFVPQLTEWRQFEQEMNPHSSQMTKYFSSPSKSMHSMYSEDELYYLLGENDSMKRLITEKDAVIDSLQEQVNNAKEKLLKLMSVSHLQDEGEMDSSTTNLNSSSTQTTIVPPDQPPSTIPVEDSEISPSVVLSPPPYIPPPSHPSVPRSVPLFETQPCGLAGSSMGASSASKSIESRARTSENTQISNLRLECLNLTKENLPHSSNMVSTGTSAVLKSVVELDRSEKATDKTNISDSSAQLSSAWSNQPRVDLTESVIDAPVATRSRQGFVSSKQLQEILHDLSVDAMSSMLKSPLGVRQTFNPATSEANISDPLSSTSHSQSYFPRISPYMMRKRRPPFNTCKSGPPPYYFPGSAPPGCRKDPASSTGSAHFQTRIDNSNQNGADEEETRTENSGACFDAQSQRSRRNMRRGHRKSPAIRRPPSCLAPPHGGSAEESKAADSYSYSDSESSSSEDYCYYHRPYCDACRHSSCASSDSSSSETSENEFEELYQSSHPVVNFKEDLKPTFV